MKRKVIVEIDMRPDSVLEDTQQQAVDLVRWAIDRAGLPARVLWPERKDERKL